MNAGFEKQKLKVLYYFEQRLIGELSTSNFNLSSFFSTGRLRNARHWDWLGQALEAGFLRGQPPDKGTAPSKEQLLLERRQKIVQGNMEPQVSPYIDKIFFNTLKLKGQNYLGPRCTLT